MAVSGFDNLIEVVIGAGWDSNFISEDEIIILQLAETGPADMYKKYSEDGTLTPSYSNRISVNFSDADPGTGTQRNAVQIYHLLNTTSTITLTLVAQLLRDITTTASLDYSFKEAFSNTSTQTLSTWTNYPNITFTSNISDYNPDIFKSMITYNGYIDLIEDEMSGTTSVNNMAEFVSDIDDSCDLEGYITYTPQYDTIEDTFDLEDLSIISLKFIHLNDEELDLEDFSEMYRATYFTNEDTFGLEDYSERYRATLFLIEDQALLIGAIRFGCGFIQEETITIDESIKGSICQLLNEKIKLVESVISQWKGVDSIYDKMNMVDTPIIVGMIDDLLEDGMSLTDVSKLILNSLIADVMGFSCSISNLAKVQHSILESLTATDVSIKSWDKVAYDSMALTESLTATWFAIVAIADAFTATDLSTPARLMLPYISEEMNIADFATIKQIVTSIILDNLGITITLSINDELWECWVLNTNAFHVSVYSGYEFNSYCVFNDVAYGCKSDGIFSLDGTTDDGSAFKSGIVLPETSFGSARHKRFRKAYFGISGSSPTIKIETDNGSATYTISDSKASITRGLKGKDWTLTLQDFDSIDFIELIPVVLTR